MLTEQMKTASKLGTADVVHLVEVSPRLGTDETDIGRPPTHLPPEPSQPTTVVRPTLDEGGPPPGGPPSFEQSFGGYGRGDGR